MEFPRQDYGSRLSFPSPGDLPDPGIEPVSPALAGGFFTAKPQGKTTKPFVTVSQIDSNPNLVTKISVLFPLFVSHLCPPYIRSPLQKSYSVMQGRDDNQRKQNTYFGNQARVGIIY